MGVILTFVIGNGVIQDIAAPAERGAFISFYQASMSEFPVLTRLHFTNIRDTDI